MCFSKTRRMIVSFCVSKVVEGEKLSCGVPAHLFFLPLLLLLDHQVDISVDMLIISQIDFSASKKKSEINSLVFLSL